MESGMAEVMANARVGITLIGIIGIMANVKAGPMVTGTEGAMANEAKGVMGIGKTGAMATGAAGMKIIIPEIPGEKDKGDVATIRAEITARIITGEMTTGDEGMIATGLTDLAGGDRRTTMSRGPEGKIFQ